MSKAEKIIPEIGNGSASVIESRPPLMIRAGRGNSGGTTALNATIELALQDGRAPILLDAARNPGLSTLYGTASRAPSHALRDVKAAITGVLDGMMETGAGGVIDLGGGQDDTLVAFYQELNLVEFGRDAQIRPVFLVTFGPDMGDFDHALEIKARGIFRGADVLLVQSAGALRQGQDAEDAFGRIIERPELAAWINEGARLLYLSYLAPMEEVKKRGIPLRDAARDVPKDGQKLGYTRAYQVRNFLDKWRKQFVEMNCEDWRV